MWFLWVWLAQCPIWHKAFAETKTEADSILGGFLSHLAVTHFHTTGLHSLPLLFPLLLRTFQASISWFMSNSSSSSVADSWHNTWWAVCPAEPSPASAATPLQSRFLSDASQGEILWLPSGFFFLLLPPGAYFCVVFYCFPGLCPPTPAVRH